MNHILDWVSLSLVPGLGDVTIRALVRHFGSGREVLRATRKQLIDEAGLRPGVAGHLLQTEAVYGRGEAELERVRRFGARALCPEDELYPRLLNQISKPPAVLYTLGNQDLLGGYCVAMVGSRAATTYGRRSAHHLAGQLAGRGVVVVSGVALGIDTHAHAGCLAVSGATIGVLGCGLDVVYPQQNLKLYKQIREQGLLISEYPLGTRPDGFRFPARNRIIAGLSLGVVIVEAARKSGSLITADMALEEGREIFAVPGRIDSFKSAGTHWLLQQGAKLVQSVDDILDELAPGVIEESPAPEGTSVQPVIQEGSDEAAVLACLDGYPMKRDELIHNVSLSAARVNELLLLLELEGLVEVESGGEIRKRMTREIRRKERKE